jgi:hypothetical protein
MKRKPSIVIAAIAAVVMLAGCAGVGVQFGGSGNQQEAVNMGLELLAFNGGYLLVDKYPDKYQAVQAEITAFEAILAGNNVDAANAAFQLGIQKLLKATNNDPLVAANISYLSKKIQFTSTAEGGKPVIDIPQMKLIVENFKAGADARILMGYAKR